MGSLIIVEEGIVCIVCGQEVGVGGDLLASWASGGIGVGRWRACLACATQIGIVFRRILPSFVHA
jgi:hypothetical protein